MLKWIAAGTGYHSFAGVSIFVKLKKRVGPYIEKAYPHGFAAKLLDREIFVVRPGYKEYNMALPLNSYDYCVNADLLGYDSAIKHTGLMFTYDPTKSKQKGMFDKSKSEIPIMGDCVIGDTHVFTDKGLFEIEELIQHKTGYGYDSLNLSTPNGINNTIRSYKSKKRVVKTLKTKRNYFLTASTNEPIMTDSGWKELNDIRSGEKVAIVVGANIWADQAVEFNFNYMEYLDNEFKDYPEECKCKICGESFQKLDSHVLFKQGLTLTQYKQKYDIKYICSKAVRIKHSTDNNIDDRTIPNKMTKKLARLLGYLIAYGSIGKKTFRIHCGIEKDVALDAISCIESVFPTLGYKLDSYYTGNESGSIKGTGVKVYIVESQRSSKVLSFLNYIGCKSVTAGCKEVPWSILRSSRIMVCEFLKSLYESDGYVSKLNSTCIEYCSHSTKLRRQVRSLLTNLGIVSYLYESKRTTLPPTTKLESRIVNNSPGRIHIYDNYGFKCFNEIIGFVSRRKKKRLTEHIKRIKTNGEIYHNNTVPDEKNIIWDKVISIRKENEKMKTYDFTVSNEEHSYIANGLYVHNSGGFQLLGGKKEFLDPVLLSQWYNKVVHRGTALDMPLFVGASDSIQKKSARVQKANIKVMLDNLDPDIVLYNISHGFTYENRKRFIDTVYNDKLKNWAIGCTYYGNVFDFIYNIFSVITYVKAESYHVFGMANTSILPILAWVGKYHDLTSDSSSHLQSGRCSTMFSVIKHNLKKFHVGASKGDILHSKELFPHLNCSCPVCSAIGTTELMHYSRYSGMAHSCCILHNINVMAKYVSIWSQIAEECTLPEYKKIIAKAFPKKKVKYWYKIFDYIEAIRLIGFEKASKAYRADLSLFGEEETYDGSTDNLFGDVKEDEYNETEDLEKRLETIYALYKEYHLNKDFKFKAKKKKKKEKIILKDHKDPKEDKKGKKIAKNKMDKSKKKMGIHGTIKKSLKLRKRKKEKK